MSLLAAHLNDAGIAVISDAKVAYREPGVALLDDDGIVTGNAAFESARLKPRRVQNRYFMAMSMEPLGDRRFPQMTSADLVSRQLEQVWREASHAGDRLVVAVPAWLDTSQLALFLGIAAELSIPIAGMVDAAVAATRREYPGAVAVHVDLGLHVAALSRLAQPGQAQLERSAVVESAGLLPLYDAWIRTIADAFVKQSRFDPLHTAETEQLLQDRLPGWLAEASGRDRIELQVEYRAIEHSAVIESLDLQAAAAPVYQRIVSQLRALYRAEDQPAIQLSDRAARMPGLADTLRARVGGEVFLLEPGATARGLLGRCRDFEVGDGQVALVRQLPWDQAPAAPAVVDESKHAAGQPTHVLFENRAFSIGERPLSLGTQPAGGERWIDLAQDMPGVSRRHCTVERQNGQCVVTDFSRYGTFLNGHRIDGSAVLQIGDLIRLGTPGFELRLITTDESDGA